VDEKILKEHWDLYFSDDDEFKKDFEKSIISKFKEGETFVMYC
jgi:hypothetical protein